MLGIQLLYNLVTNSMHALSRTVSEIVRRFPSKSAIFPTPLYLTPALSILPSEFRNTVWAQKGIMSLSFGEKNIMPPPLIDIKRCFCLTSDVCRVHRA